MNWVGGSRSRVKLQGDRRVQKEFFEKKKLDLKCEKILKQSVCKTPATRKKHVSQDLLALHTVSKTSGLGQKSRQSTVKEVNLDHRYPCHLRIFNKENAGDAFNTAARRVERVELPFSPNAGPSKLDLLEAEHQCSKSVVSPRPALKHQQGHKFASGYMSEGAVSFKHCDWREKLPLPQWLPSQSKVHRAADQQTARLAPSSMTAQSVKKRPAANFTSDADSLWMPEDFQKSPSDITHCQGQNRITDEYSVFATHFQSQEAIQANNQWDKESKRYTSPEHFSPQFCDAIMSSEEALQKIKNKKGAEVSGYSWSDIELSSKKVRVSLGSPSWSLSGSESVHDRFIQKEEAADDDDFSFKMRPLFASRPFVSKEFPSVCHKKRKHKETKTLYESSITSCSSLLKSEPTGRCSQFNLEDIFHVPSTYQKSDTFHKLTALIDSGAVRSDQTDWTSCFTPHYHSGHLATDLVHKLRHTVKQIDIREQAYNMKRDKKKLDNHFFDTNTEFDTSNNTMWTASSNYNHPGDEVLLELGELEKETLCTDCGENTGSAVRSDEPLEAAGATTTRKEEAANMELDVESAVQNTIEKIDHSVVLLESQRSMKESASFRQADADDQLFTDSSRFASECKDLQTIRSGDRKTTFSVLVQTDWSLMDHNINHRTDLCSKQWADKAVQWESPSPKRKKEQELLALADSTQTSETEFTKTDDHQKAANFCLSPQGSKDSVLKPSVHYSLRSKSKNRAWNESKPASMLKPDS